MMIWLMRLAPPPVGVRSNFQRLGIATSIDAAPQSRAVDRRVPTANNAAGGVVSLLTGSRPR